MALHAHRFHLIDSLERGDLTAIDIDLAACADLAAALRQPYYLWYAEYLRATRTLLEGRIADAERLAGQALAIGLRSQSRNVQHLYGGQMLWIRREQGRIFRKFYRVQRELGGGPQGTGLGLAIVDHTMRGHGGFVRVESEPERGSTFSLHFPIPSENAFQGTLATEGR